MKKCFTLLTLLFLVMAGTVKAQVTWDLVDDPLKEITPGQTVVIQEGTYASWSANGYLNSEQDMSAANLIQTINTSAVWKFIEKGETADGLPTYVLFNLGNKMYLKEDGYTKSKDEAFEMTALLAQVKTETKGDIPFHRDNIEGKRQPNSEGVAFVFCSPTAVKYLSYISNPGFNSYCDTNAWFVYAVTEHEMTAREIFDAAFDKAFTVEVTVENYPTGTTPGCLPEAVFEEFSSTYAEALEAQATPGMSDEALKALADKINDIWARVAAERIQVTPGYYLIYSQRSQDVMADYNNYAACYLNWTKPEVLTANEANRIWEVEEIDGKLYMKNFGTGRYMGVTTKTSTQYPMTAEPTTSYTIPYSQRTFFNLVDANGNVTHCDAGGAVVLWNDKAAAGGLWKFEPVGDDVINSLRAQVEQAQKNSKLATLLKEARNTSENYKYDTDCTMDDAYAKPGLVTAMTAANATEPTEGSEAALFDGDNTTYYHTLWSNTDPRDDYDWIQLDLGKEVQHLFIKMSQRHNNRNGNPSRISLVTNDDVAGTVWTDTLMTDTVIYQYATNFSSVLDSTTAVMRVDLGKPVQHLRFVVKQTKANQNKGGLGPCWHLSELRFYEDNGENPRYTLIPQAVKDELARLIDVADKEVKNGMATDETYDALRKAIDAFNESYPDPSGLNALLEEAAAQAESAVEGTEMGYFQEGAKEKLQGVVTKVQAEIAERILTLDEIAKYEAEVRAGIQEFTAALIGPNDGGVYRIKSVSTKSENAVLGSFITAANADMKTALQWVKDDNYDTNLNLFWQAEKKEDGTYSFRNLVTGRYMSNLYKNNAEVAESTPLTQAATPDTITLISAKVGGQFMLQLAEGHFLNTSADNGKIVTWWESDDENARFVFEEVSEWDGMYSIPVAPQRLQVISLPIPISGEVIEDSYYEVLGKKDGKLQLGEITDDVIPAGTPIIIDMRESEADINTVFILPAASSLEELVEIDHNYAPVDRNGLFSALEATTPGAGMGLFIDGMIKISDKNDVVAAGSGYLRYINDTEEDGALAIEIEGEVTGIGNAVLVRNSASDVYTLTGVKVRQNVKGAEALKDLPKGIYIVGGKKVLVK